MKYYPVLLKIKGEKCVVVGGGKVAERKIKEILSCGGKVTVISPQITEGLEDLFSRGKIEWHKGFFGEHALEGAYLIIAATNKPEVNRQVAEEARRKGILVNVANSEKLSNFILPAVVRRGGLILAVSTSGKSPALARKIKEKLQRNYGQEYALLVKIVSRVRKELLRQGKHLIPEQWQRLLNEGLIDLIRQGKEGAAYERLMVAAKKATNNQ